MEMKYYTVELIFWEDECRDAVLGTSEEDALLSAYRNWPDAVLVKII